jgi:hypothetical protein
VLLAQILKKARFIGEAINKAKVEASLIYPMNKQLL